LVDEQAVMKNSKTNVEYINCVFISTIIKI